MKKSIILILMLFLLVASVSAQIDHFYSINLVYQQGNLSYNIISVEPSEEKLKTPEGDYIAEVVSFDNEVLNLTYFDMSRKMFIDSVNPETEEIDYGAIIELNESEITLYVPYYENAKEINIYDWDLNKKLNIKVDSYAKETAIVEEVEGEIIEEDQKEIVPKKEIEKEEPIKKVLFGVLIGLGILILLIFILVLFFRKKKVSPET